MTVTFSSFFSSETSCLTFGMSHFSALPTLVPMEPEVGMFIETPSPPETPFIAQNIDARSHRLMSLSTMSVSRPAPMVG